MLKARQLRWVSLLFLLFCQLGCQPAQHTDHSELLLYDSTAERLTISPATVPVESLLTLQLKALAAIADISAEVTGDSMYMGRVPVRFEPLADDLWQAEFLLGACTDPNMRWRLMVKIRYQDGREVLIHETFQSSWR